MSIWDYKEVKNTLENPNSELLTLNEGKTSIDKARIENIEIIIKREDKNPTGSWKDRATAYKLTKLLSEGIHEGVISTSGNAAISYLTYIKNLHLEFKLHVVVGMNIDEDKLRMLNALIEGTENKIYQDENPKKKSVELAAELKIANLKSAIDEDALKGYWSLGFEIAELLNPQESNQDVGVFIPASSGTGCVGTAQGIFMKLGQEYLLPRICVCQTGVVHPFVTSEINIAESSETKSLADAIIDTSGLRAPQVSKIIHESNGEALAITNKELEIARDILAGKNIANLSYNSLLSIAGFLKIKEKYNFKKVICIASGR